MVAPSPGRSSVEFSSLFLERADNFARAVGNKGYRPMHGKITKTHIAKHISGEMGLGAYIIRAEDDKVRMIAIDLDQDDEALVRAIASTLVVEVPDTSLLVERTGSRGWHIWVFLDDWIEAKDARAFVRYVLGGLNLSSPIEIYPKQDKKHGGLGNLVRLPLGIHHKTGNPSTVFNAFMLPIEIEGADPDLPVIPAPITNILTLARKKQETETSAFVRAGPSTAKLPCIEKFQEGVGKGARDEAMFRLAAYLHRQQIPKEAAWVTLVKANDKSKPPLSSEELNSKLQSAYSGAGYGLPCSSSIVGLDSEYCSPICPVYLTAKGERPTGESLSGEFPRVVEREGCYWFQTRIKDGIREAKLSNFSMEVISRLEMPDSGPDVLRLEMKTTKGRKDVMDIPVSAFSSKGKLIETLPRAEYAWYGADVHCQYLKACLTGEEMSTQKAVIKLGRIEMDGQDLWVMPDGVLGAEGPIDVDNFTYHRPIHLGKVAVNMPKKSFTAARVKTALAALMDVNVLSVMVPLLGWVFSVPFKPYFMKTMGHFPLLMLYGTRGAGKTQLIQRAVLPLFGYNGQEPQIHFCDTTRFVLVSYGAATTSIPIFLDEYRPNALTGTKLRQLWDQWRHLYAEDTDHRGQANLTRLEFKQTSPTIVAGEEMVIDPAMQERMIQVQMSPDTLTPAIRKAFTNLPPMDMACKAFLTECLSLDPDPIMQAAKTNIAGEWERKAPPRIYDNMLVVSFGLEVWGAITGKDITDRMRASIMDLSTMVMDSKGNIRTSVWADEFLLDIYGMVSNKGPFNWGMMEYLEDGRSLMHFNLRQAHSEWSKELKARGDQAVGIEPIRRQLDEDAAGEFIIEKGSLRKMVGKMPVKVYTVDMTLAVERIDT